MTLKADFIQTFIVLRWYPTAAQRRAAEHISILRPVESRLALVPARGANY
jgi:hypothetical protein